MSISSVGASGAGHASQLLARMLSRLDQTNTDDTSPSATATNTASENCKTPAISGQGTLSDKILGLMIMLQAQGSSSSQGGADPVAQTFQAMDGDGDGSISQAEMETYVQNLGGTQAEADKLFAGLAGESSDGISKDKFQAAAIAGRPGPEGPRPHGGHHGGGAKEIFDALDTNQDGTVSADELAAAFPGGDTNATSSQSVFAQMDGNGDGGVAKDEFSSFLDALTDRAKSDANLLTSFRDLAARSYGVSENLLSMPADTGKSIEA